MPASPPNAHIGGMEMAEGWGAEPGPSCCPGLLNTPGFHLQLCWLKDKGGREDLCFPPEQIQVVPGFKFLCPTLWELGQGG